MKLKGVKLEGTYKVIYYATWFEVYDEKGNVIYYENSKGFWAKWKYDEEGKQIYFENSKGFWVKWKYDEKGNVIYYENSDGYWSKGGYNEKGKRIYFEDSNSIIIDERAKELTIE